MNKRIIFGALMALVFVLAPEMSQARWMNTNAGRFQTMDSYEGEQETPQSLHRYTYTQDDPVNRIDPNGQFDDLSTALTTLNGIASEASSAVGLNVARVSTVKLVAGITTAIVASEFVATQIGEEPALDVTVRPRDKNTPSLVHFSTKANTLSIIGGQLLLPKLNGGNVYMADLLPGLDSAEFTRKTLELGPDNTAESFVGVKFKRPVLLRTNFKDTHTIGGTVRLEYIHAGEVTGGDAKFFGPFENNPAGHIAYEVLEPSM